MKRHVIIVTLSLMVAFSAIFAAGCSKSSENLSNTSENPTTDSSDNNTTDDAEDLPKEDDEHSSESIPENSKDNNSEETNNASDKPIYDDMFEGIDSTPTTGMPMSYEDVMDMLEFVKKEGIFLDSFYLVETVRPLTLDECEQLAGWTPFFSNKTVYEVNILEDLISGEKVGRTAKVVVGMGTVKWQHQGDPIYAPGEKFTVALTKPQDGYDYLQTPISILFRYDIVDDGNGNIILYSRGNESEQLNLAAAEKITESVITSTTMNPVFHLQKVELNALVDFLRSDWQQRGISSHFENTGSAIDDS